MRRFFVYTRLQFKRALRYAPFLFLITLVICLCLSLALVSLIRADGSEADQNKIRVGVVGRFESGYLGFGISAIQSLDSSRYSLDILELSEEEAKEGLRGGELAGYVVIPESFVDEAMSGRVGKLKFVTTDTNAGIVTLFKQEVLDFISRLIVQSQNGVYGMQDAMTEYDVEYDVIVESTNKIATEYVGLILNRSNALDVKVTGVSDSLSFGGYMFSGLGVLLVLLSGIACCSLFVLRDTSFGKLMSADRYSPFAQIVSEYLAFFAVMLVNTLVLLFILMWAGRGAGAVKELADFGAAEMFSLLIKFIPAVAMITAFQFLLYQLSDSLVSGVLMQFVSAVLLGYVSGCFYPISFFPRAIRTFSGLLPSGIAREYLSSLLAGKGSAAEVVPIAVCFAVFIALSVLVRGYRIRRA